MPPATASGSPGASSYSSLNGDNGNACAAPAYGSVAVRGGAVPDETDKVRAAVDNARKTFASGCTKPIEWREGALKALRRMMTENKDDFYASMKADLNKNEFEVWLSEYQFVLGEIDEMLHNLAKYMRPESLNTNMLNMPGSSQIVKDPLGVVLLISPWNYPFQLMLAPLVGLLAAGNTCVLKPSELSAQTSLFVARHVPKYLEQYGVYVVQGAVPPTTALLRERFDLIFYTGGGTVAKIIMRAAAEHLTPVVLELGGKSPVIVLKDANLKIAAKRLAWAKLMNTGQTCIAPDYIMVEESVHDEFCRELKSAIETMYGKCDASLRQNSDYGRIISVGHAKRLAGLVVPAEPGQELLVGDASLIDTEQRFLPPLVVTGVQAEHRVMRDEIFGPVLPILKMRASESLTGSCVEDCIAFINQREKPLALYMFTRSDEHIKRVLAATSSGGVTVNDAIVHVTNPDLPFGGVGQSGMGSYHGAKSFDTFTHRKSVLIRNDWALLDAPQRYPPYTADKSAFMQRALGIQALSMYKPQFYAAAAVCTAGAAALLITKFAAKLW